MALFLNLSASYNTANGYQTLYTNSKGHDNTALGSNALFSDTASNNTATGSKALYYNTGGADNVANGIKALYNTTLGGDNVAIGANAGYTNTTGVANTFVGYAADASAGNLSNASAFGNSTVVTASNKMFFGNASITNIQGQVGFTTYSDGRFKINVVENVKGLEFINKLRPITYNMDTKALDDFIIQNMSDSAKTTHQTGLDFTPSKAIVHSGFIAQEVEQAAQQVGFVSSIVSAPSNSNDPYALSYAEIVVPLVKAVQELSKNLDSLQTKTTKLDSTNAAKDAELQALQNQITALNEIVNTCCGILPTKTMQQNNSNPETITNSNSKDVAILYQNKPNPFNNQTVIGYYVPTSSIHASIIIFDMQGRLLKTIALEQKENGSIKIEAGSLIPGMYMYSLVIDEKEIDTKRMILTK